MTHGASDLVAFELHEIEIAVLSRSAESLRGCLMSQFGTGPDGALMTPVGYFQVLFLSLGWPEGLMILLESPLRYAGNKDDWIFFEGPVGHCFVVACQQREIECASILLEYIETIDLENLEAASRLGDIALLTQMISALVKSRRKLQQLAIEHLPHDVLCSLSLPSSTLLDTKAFDVYEALADHNIELEPLHFERGSVYGFASNDITIFERLYTAGFTDLNQCDGISITSLMSLYYGGLSKDPYKLIKSADWLVFRGANLYQLSEEGYPSFFSLADAFGGNLGDWYRYHGKKSGQDLRSLMLEQHPDILEFLCLLITDDSCDGCSCACSNRGCCSSYQQILRGFFRDVEDDGTWPHRDSSTTAFTAMIDVLHSAAPGQVSEDQGRDIALQTIQYLTFDPLDITHTCHKNTEFFDSFGFEVEQLDDEEIQEIREEQATLIGQLDELVSEFITKYDELGHGLHDFLEEYLKPRLDEIFDSDSEEKEEVDPDYEQRVRELGVNLR
jgi:hypothetical protein